MLLMLAITSSLHQQNNICFQEESHGFIRCQVNSSADLRKSGLLEASHISHCLWNTPEATATETTGSRKYFDSRMPAGVFPGGKGFRKFLPWVSQQCMYIICSRISQEGWIEIVKVKSILTLWWCSILIALSKIMKRLNEIILVSISNGP